MTKQKVTMFETSMGAKIFQIPMEAFPDFWAYAYLVDFGGRLGLIDTGSGFGHSNQHLEEGIKVAAEIIGKQIGWDDISYVFITHGHIDHFGGLNYARSRCDAVIGVHELDKRSVTNIDERLNLVAIRLKQFFLDAGVNVEEASQLITLYKMSKLNFSSVEVDFTFGQDEKLVEFYDCLHVPGHSAGHVCLKLHDVVFCGDHILSDISPHQAPERITMNTGLTHYLASLDLFDGWTEEVKMALPGHHDVIYDVHARVDAIKKFHQDRLERILELTQQPKTIEEIAREMFGKVDGYNRVLALEEIGAHVEYLYQRSLLRIVNWETVAEKDENYPWLYQRL